MGRYLAGLQPVHKSLRFHPSYGSQVVRPAAHRAQSCRRGVCIVWHDDLGVWVYLRCAVYVE